MNLTLVELEDIHFSPHKKMTLVQIIPLSHCSQIFNFSSLAIDVNQKGDSQKFEKNLNLHQILLLISAVNVDVFCFK